MLPFECSFLLVSAEDETGRRNAYAVLREGEIIYERSRSQISATAQSLQQKPLIFATAQSHPDALRRSSRDSATVLRGTWAASCLRKKLRVFRDRHQLLVRPSASQLCPETTVIAAAAHSIQSSSKKPPTGRYCSPRMRCFLHTLRRCISCDSLALAASLVIILTLAAYLTITQSRPSPSRHTAQQSKSTDCGLFYSSA